VRHIDRGKARAAEQRPELAEQAFAPRPVERAEGLVEHEQAGLGSPGIDELRWTKPVYPGDTLHVRGKIIEKTPSRSKPHMGSFRTHTVVTNQDNVPVMSFTSIVLIRRRPDSARG
jgi:acyl dehydratase